MQVSSTFTRARRVVNVSHSNLSREVVINTCVCQVRKMSSGKFSDAHGHASPVLWKGRLSFILITVEIDKVTV